MQVTTDPRWGRFYENFGESEVLVGATGAAMTLGLLNANGSAGGGPSSYLPASNFSLIPFAKHAIAYGMSNADGYAVSIAPRELQEVYLRPWREFVAAGSSVAPVCACVCLCVSRNTPPLASDLCCSVCGAPPALLCHK